jgi:hypothetical protein
VSSSGRARFWLDSCALAFALAAFVACTPAESLPPAPKTYSKAPQTDPGGGLAKRGEDAFWTRVAAKRFALSVALPRLREWTIDDASTPWFLARHTSTHSELRLRAWNAVRSVTPEQCEEQARLWLPWLPDVALDGAVARRPLRAPQGYRGHVIASVRALERKATLDGYVQAIGVNIGRCYAAIFTTRASGPHAEEELGRALALIVGGVLERVEMRTIDDRAPTPQFPF